MDSPRADSDRQVPIDLSALAWVHDELRRSLEAAHKALRRFMKDSDTVFDADTDDVDPAVLRGARQQIHQGVGALELVGLPAAARVLRASESVVHRLVAKPRRVSAQTVDAIEHVSFALLDYIGRLLAGKRVSALSLFPQYRAVQELAGAERIHPSDLWASDWRWMALPDDPTAQPLATDARSEQLLEQQLLGLMRAGSGDKRAAAFDRMSQVCAGLGAGTAQPKAATLWKLAAAVFEAQAQGLLEPDVFSKRAASRLLPQFRIFAGGSDEVSDRLAQDLLFFCAQADAPAAGRSAPRLDAVRQNYHLGAEPAADYNASVLGRFDPALVTQAKKRVTSAKEAWGAVAGGDLHRLAGLSEQFSLVGDSLRRLIPAGEVLADELQTTITQAQHSGAAPGAPLAMEVATSLLFLEATLDDGEFDGSGQRERVGKLAQRIAAVRAGEPPQALDAWMEELYRRVSERQTLGSVVHEMRAALSESEKLIDQYFRNPAEREVLTPVPAQLQAMRGVLSVLGLDHASQAALRMRDDIDALLQTEVDPQRTAAAGIFDRLAGNLGALGFLIDMFSVQPQMAKSLFRFDADSATLVSVMGQHKPAAGAAAAAAPRLIEQAQSLAFSAARADVELIAVTRDLERLSHEAQAAAQPELVAAVNTAQAALDAASDEAEIAAARASLSEALVEFVHTATDAAGLEPLAAPAPAPSTAGTAGELDGDDEMREIFLEEAREVLTGAHEALAALRAEPADLATLTTLRRAFHTLKGSSRMVGLHDYGAAAWICEQQYNTVLALQQAADAALIDFTAAALEELESWVDAIAGRESLDRFQAETMQRRADALAEAGAAPADSVAPLAPGWPETSAIPQDAPADAPVLPEAQPAIDEAFAFTLDFGDAPVADAPPAAPTPPIDAPAVAEDPALDFAFDLGAFDAGAAASATAGEAAPAEPAAAAFDAFATQPFPRDRLADVPPDVPADAPADADAAPRVEIASQSEPDPSAFQDTGFETGFEADLAAEADAEPHIEDEQFKQIGELRVPIPLFNIYLNEADELSRRLGTELAEWAMELDRPVGESTVALAHSLAGSSATVGFADLSQLSRALEHALERSRNAGHGDAQEVQLYVDVADDIRRLLHQFAAGFLKTPQPGLAQRLAEHEAQAQQRRESDDERDAACEPPVDAIVAAMAEPDEGLEDAQPASAAQAVDEELAAPAPEVAPEASEVEPEVAPEAATSAFAASAFAADSQHGAFGLPELKALEEVPDPLAEGVHASDDADDDEADIDAIDAVDAELFPIFEEEGQELLPQLSARLREWARRPDDSGPAAGAMRTLHTLKGGARLAGAMRLGEMCHRLETRIEHLSAHTPVDAEQVEALQARGDALVAVFEALRSRDAQAYAEATAAAVQAADASIAPAAADDAIEAMEAMVALPDAQAAEADGDARAVQAPAGAGPEAAADATAQPPADRPPAAALPEIDWSRFGAAAPGAQQVADRATGPVSAAAVRVRAPLLDRMVNQAGEVSITRSRIEAEVGLIKSSLGDLSDNLERLRQQLREIELQGETQMSSRLEAAKAAAEAFDPLELDRFTRFQELTRMMAESVNDVATVQRTLARAVQSTEDELAAQTRLTRDLQDDLLRTRMVEFESQADRLYRVVRQAAKETGKQVRLDIVGGAIELDRGVLDRMTASFEHLLRNCVTHGIEAPDARVAAGKDATGSIVVALAHEHNEVSVVFRDDGGGLDLPRIRDKGLAAGLISADAQYSDAELANLIFSPGLSTASSVTELAGRGVGMDVVRSDVNAMGGRIETATAAGRGTSFKLVLPLTTAVTQVVMLRCGSVTVAVPSTLVEVVQRATPEQVEQAYASGAYPLGERSLPFFWLGALLHQSARGTEGGRMRSVVVIRSAQQRIALHVDEVLGNQEAVVKNLGPQLSRLPGLAGMTLLASGAVALIYNPVALAALYADSAHAMMRAGAEPPPGAAPVVEAAATAAPLVMVVDDSLTVRRVTQRLLVREGYRVVVAKDGLDALERLAEERPQVVLSDIEMPRMDGFDLVRNIRGDERLRDLPVIMITSRIAQKHRDVAAELGVEHYLGKPYSEEDLLALVGRYAASEVAA
jgi:chemosensory pili system protein ChpA (sensor histidine kinase/response regulator)